MEMHIKLFAKFLSKVQGPSTEIVLYDCKKDRREMLYNGAATGRNMDDGDYREDLDRLKKLASEVDDFLVGYGGKSVNDQPLRMSSLFLKDEKGDLEYILCVNQNVVELERFQDFLNYFLNLKDKPEDAVQGDNETVENLMTSLINQEVEAMKLSGLDINLREVRYEILKKLNGKGLFDIKGSVPKVCEVLGISQATLYNTLKEINKDVL